MPVPCVAVVGTARRCVTVQASGSSCRVVLLSHASSLQLIVVEDPFVVPPTVAVATSLTPPDAVAANEYRMAAFRWIVSSNDLMVYVSCDSSERAPSPHTLSLHIHSLSALFCEVFVLVQAPGHASLSLLRSFAAPTLAPPPRLRSCTSVRRTGPLKGSPRRPCLRVASPPSLLLR